LNLEGLKDRLQRDLKPGSHLVRNILSATPVTADAGSSRTRRLSLFASLLLAEEVEAKNTGDGGAGAGLARSAIYMGRPRRIGGLPASGLGFVSARKELKQRLDCGPAHGNLTVLNQKAGGLTATGWPIGRRLM
jgi:hypothetical protein